MIRGFFILTILLFFFCTAGCNSQGDQSLVLGASQTEAYFPDIRGKKIGLLVNHTSMAGRQHLVDFLLDAGMEIRCIFAPEHGFRGQADAGETVQDDTDTKTGIKVVSLYGKNKKPSPAMMQGLDVVIFDIQDVGARFYTYISSMHYMMEACAENGVKMLVLDRPNPNGGYIDGPVLDTTFKSFVGMHPIPVVHGLTVGELALMINDEHWLAEGKSCDLKVVAMKNYNHADDYSLPVKPSPNLPNDRAIALYPSLCFFEGTRISVGRGTTYPFQVIGYPDPAFGSFEFTPQSIPGMAKHPKHEGKTCYSLDLRNTEMANGINLQYVIDYYHKWHGKEGFFTPYFDTLAGTDTLRKQIEAGKSLAEIKESWQPALTKYRQLRKKYLLYHDFNEIVK